MVGMVDLAGRAAPLNKFDKKSEACRTVSAPEKKRKTAETRVFSLLAIARRNLLVDGSNHSSVHHPA
jgi:hypothetical protein